MPKRPPKSTAFGASFSEAKRPPLHRDRVVDAAVAILDADGPAALTFRRLATDLDVGAATIYWHVENKDALLRLALDRVLGEMHEEAATVPERSWEERVRDAFVELWRVLYRHPWAATLAISSIDRGPNLLRHWDRSAMVMLDAGFDEHQVFYGLSTLFTYVLGSATQNATWHTYGPADDTVHQDTLAQATAYFSSLDPAVYPSFQRVMPVLADHDEDEQIHLGLDLLISGLRFELGHRA